MKQASLFLKRFQLLVSSCLFYLGFAWAHFRFFFLKYMPVSHAFYDSLKYAPQALQSADAANGEHYYQGYFSFCGQSISIDPEHLFTHSVPSTLWAQKFYSFEWLKDLRALNRPEASQRARLYISQWMALHKRSSSESLYPDLCALRLITFLSHSRFILEGADRLFYERFCRYLMHEMTYLNCFKGVTGSGLAMFTLVTARYLFCLCFEHHHQRLRAIQKDFERQIRIQIREDGAHISRNCDHLVHFLLLLLPVEALSKVSNRPLSDFISPLIDKMLCHLSLMRHQDGSLACFHGAGLTQRDNLLALLSYRPLKEDLYRKRYISSGGYERLYMGDSLVFMDAGAPPPLFYSGEAHASCFAFEFSRPDQKFVVNCSRYAFPLKNMAGAAYRASQAHSMACLDYKDNVRWVAPAPHCFSAERHEILILDHGLDLRVRHVETDNALLVGASHDFYVSSLGYMHKRALTLSEQGSFLSGEDHFQNMRTVKRAHHFQGALFFHLHPDLRVEHHGDGLHLFSQKEHWLFQAKDFKLSLEPSLYLAHPHGPKPCQQIIVSFTVPETQKIKWAFKQQFS